MSYARWGWDGSDVYVILSGRIECCGCSLAGEDGQWGYDSTDEMLAHLREHERAGDTVPESCVERLEAERDDIDAYIAQTLEARS